MKYKISLHIFRRDLRLHDNAGLLAALRSSQAVIPCFIFDKRQIQDNPYYSEKSIQFMAHSLHELDSDLKKKSSKLYLFYGITENVVSQLIKVCNIQAIFINRDYTPFSQTRDHAIKKICEKLKVDLHIYSDTLLHEPEEILKTNKQPYTVFTHFFNKAADYPVALPKKNLYKNYYQELIPFEDKTILAKLLSNDISQNWLQGGRKEALKLLNNIKNLHNYSETHNFPFMRGTTYLSAHNKFGTISIREMYAEIIKNFGKENPLLKELYWRDFFTHIVFHFPNVFGESFNEKYKTIIWQKNKTFINAWCQGQTGFPIVDAGMRQLNATGFMPNRLRMITASFLTKDLHIDWRIGEKYFANQLIDYDPAVNNGNWQWVASTGCDAQPYFRIFNPWLQQKKYDPDCVYIKTWVPELKHLPAKIIHELYKGQHEIVNYPQPIVNHEIESQKAKLIYKSVSN